MKFGIIGSGSWGTAIAKILTDNGQIISWWNRSETAIKQFAARGHNPHYLPAAKFDMNLLKLTTSLQELINNSDAIIVAIPSAYVANALNDLPENSFDNKIIISAIKGILPEKNILLNDYLKEKFDLPLERYMAVLGPCHAEEVAAERLSYLTFSGLDVAMVEQVASNFKTSYVNTIINPDIFGVQYAAVLKNIYAVGAGMAHGLDYGDNFLSVFIANAADEMAGFLRKAGIINAEVGYLESSKDTSGEKHQNYAASVYLGDLLVTCYSLHSRNRSFGNMVGKGYSVKAAQLEMSMVAEGYHASKCMHKINEVVQAYIPIAATVYNILWNGLEPEKGFEELEKTLI